MAAIALSALSGLTVTYNTVQFGGSDADQKCTPPIFNFSGDYVWDESHRAIKSTKYTLTVKNIFYETSEAAQANNMQTIRRLLSQPGKVLTIEGLGSGFDLLIKPADDIFYGARPIGKPQMNMLGQMAWELVWQVEFMVKECPGDKNIYAFAAFNFDTSWENNFEGICSRTIAGYVEIAMKRTANGKRPQNVADEVRDFVNIIIPPGFRRIRNVWRENAAKDRLDFVVTDEAETGDPLPEGCIQADGEVSYESAGPGFNEAITTLSMNLRVAPGVSPSRAGVIFLTAAISKQNSMLAANPKGTVIPMGIRLSNGKFDRARQTSASMSWAMTRCINEMMAAAGIWEPVNIPGQAGTYQGWRTSVQNLWGNRGVKIEGAHLRSLANEAVIVDLCDNLSNIYIGAGPPGNGHHPHDKVQFQFTCPPVPANGGWMGHDLSLRILRKDEQTWHKKATTYLPQQGAAAEGFGEGVSLGGPVYAQNNDATKNDVEYNGLPVTYVLLQFKGLRLKHKPTLPELKSIAGIPAVQINSDQDGPKIAMDILTCPAWFIRGYRVYQINGYVSSVKAQGSETSCAAALPPSPNGNFSGHA